ncbi:MAG: hypothetical protein H0V37_12060 [Chloroflexia bacterium]|nr:hypothetical protein [Chloroflexia bacterium]
MTLVVEIEEFLKEARCHITGTAQDDAFVMICVPQSATGQFRPNTPETAAADFDTDDDDLITWEDAAWQ